ncbi:hypothetical protein C8R45DRAFT_1072435 [Mycena sanguinolenta]|nr:hypothetical protein C8R45DRAFT_1072435 [Mycena sanguinolenta]
MWLPQRDGSARVVARIEARRNGYEVEDINQRGARVSRFRADPVPISKTQFLWRLWRSLAPSDWYGVYGGHTCHTRQISSDFVTLSALDRLPVWIDIARTCCPEYIRKNLLWKLLLSCNLQGCLSGPPSDQTMKPSRETAGGWFLIVDRAVNTSSFRSATIPSPLRLLPDLAVSQSYNLFHTLTQRSYPWPKGMRLRDRDAVWAPGEQPIFSPSAYPIQMVTIRAYDAEEFLDSNTEVLRGICQAKRALLMHRTGVCSSDGISRKGRHLAHSFVTVPWATRAKVYLPGIQRLTTNKWSKIIAMSSAAQITVDDTDGVGDCRGLIQISDDSDVEVVEFPPEFWAANMAEILVPEICSDEYGCQNRMWRHACHYAARSISGGMAHLMGLVPDQPDTFYFADAGDEIWLYFKPIFSYSNAEHQNAVHAPSVPAMTIVLSVRAPGLPSRAGTRAAFVKGSKARVTYRVVEVVVERTAAARSADADEERKHAYDTC